MLSVKAPNLKLSIGNDIPILGLGTFKAVGEENLEPLGEAIREGIQKGSISRQDLFITTTDYDGPGRVLASVQRQLRQSGLDYFDLVLLYWPMVFADSDTKTFPLYRNDVVKHGTPSLQNIYTEMKNVQQRGLHSIN